MEANEFYVLHFIVTFIPRVYFRPCIQYLHNYGSGYIGLYTHADACFTARRNYNRADEPSVGIDLQIANIIELLP